MWGAIIGDLAGSIYEFEQVKKINKINISDLITSNSFFSDDTILTIAILDAVLNDNDYEKYLRKYGKDFLDYKPNYKPYFKSIFSPGYIKWLEENKIGNSIGNGAMMRISPIGYLFNTEEEVIKNTYEATIPSHNSKEAIECASIVALIIFYARNGLSKKEILNKLKLNLIYKDYKKFNCTCSETINNCLYALFTSNNFEESITTVISYGGDTDTNACIVGSMAEALYGIDKNLIELAQDKIPDEFIKKIEIGYKRIKN